MTDRPCSRDADIQHHLHTIPAGDPRHPAQVCCRCGDLFEMVDDGWPCGEFEPALAIDNGGEMPRRSGT